MLQTKLERQIVSHFKLKHLRMLVEVAKNGNITKAAKRMYLAQPSVTKSIRELEEQINTPLFIRSKKGVVLTPSGEILIRHAQNVLSQIRHASEELTSLAEGITGRLAIGTLLAVNPLLLPNSILRIRNERPQIGIQVVEGTHDQLIPSLQVGDLDMILGRLPEDREDEGVVSKVLYREPICVVVRNKHPLTEAEDLSLKDLLAYPWILPLSSTTLRKEIDNAFRAVNLSPLVNTIESVSIITNCKLLADSNMIAVMPYQVLRFYEQTNWLCALPVRLNAKLGPIGITLRKNIDRTPALQYVLDTIFAIAEEIKQSHPEII